MKTCWSSTFGNRLSFVYLHSFFRLWHRVPEDWQFLFSWAASRTNRCDQLAEAASIAWALLEIETPSDRFSSKSTSWKTENGNAVLFSTGERSRWKSWRETRCIEWPGVAAITHTCHPWRIQRGCQILAKKAWMHEGNRCRCCRWNRFEFCYSSFLSLDTSNDSGSARVDTAFRESCDHTLRTTANSNGGARSCCRHAG